MGCHPTKCSEFEKHKDGPEAYFNALKGFLTNPAAVGKVVAIGECGFGNVSKNERKKERLASRCGFFDLTTSSLHIGLIDYDRLFFCPKATQIKYFERQFELAEMTGLPMFLHDRNTSGDFAKMVIKHRKRFNQGVVHSFTGTSEDLRTYLDLGLYISINGW